MLVTKAQRHGNMSVGASDVARERVDARRLFGKTASTEVLGLPRLFG